MDPEATKWPEVSEEAGVEARSDGRGAAGCDVVCEGGPRVNGRKIEASPYEAGEASPAVAVNDIVGGIGDDEGVSQCKAVDDGHGAGLMTDVQN